MPLEYLERAVSAIPVIGTNEPNAEVRTLIHELAHTIVGEMKEDFANAYEEVIVESATYIAASAAGLDTSGESIPYVAGWGEDGAVEAIQQVAELIDRAALRIEQAISTAGENVAGDVKTSLTTAG